MRKKIYFGILVVITMGLVHIGRIFVISYELGMRADPYHETDWLHETEYEKILPLHYETDVRSLIRINSERDILQKRAQLIEFLWGSQGLSDSQLPTKIERGVVDVRYLSPSLQHHAKRAYWLNQMLNMTPGLAFLVSPIMRCAGMHNLKRIDKITVEMEEGLNSIAYHFLPVRGNNTLIIYHQGHDEGDFIAGQEVIRQCLAQGYAVIGISMPLLGMNNHPVVSVEGIGKLKIITHDYMKYLSPTTGHPVKYFLEPVATALNFVQPYQYTQIHMIGISGGGWTTTLYAAIDPRISQSYPVAGSLPIFLRSAQEFGDYEQTVPELYQIANYLELYVLGASGENRKQVQILNQYDPYCFSGKDSMLYEQAVQEKLSSLGQGTFTVYLDASHREHKISDQALKKIFQELTSNKPGYE